MLTVIDRQFEPGGVPPAERPLAVPAITALHSYRL